MPEIVNNIFAGATDIGKYPHVYTVTGDDEAMGISGIIKFGKQR